MHYKMKTDPIGLRLCSRVAKPRDIDWHASGMVLLTNQWSFSYNLLLSIDYAYHTQLQLIWWYHYCQWLVIA